MPRRVSAQPPTIQPLEPRLLFSTQKVLFIRGGSGTGGFYDGGTLTQRDEELADINNTSTKKGNHGWGELANLLRSDSFSTSQLIETSGKPVDLTKLNLFQYSTIVFGSNNATYSSTMINDLVKYVFAGGSALFISDANFGSNWGDAPDSDNEFLNKFGLAVNQDNGTYTLSRSAGDFRQPDHPILSGVNEFDGEGVSLGVRVKPVAGVTPQVLVNGKGQTKNDNNYTGGTKRNVTDNDGALVVAEAGLGRVAITFDRNTFFNANGQGTNIDRYDNKRYAKNLFEWLAGRFSHTPQVQAEDYQSENSPDTFRIAFNEDISDLTTADIKFTNRTTGSTIPVASVTFEKSSHTAIFRITHHVSTGNYRITLSSKSFADSKGRRLANDVIYNFHVTA